MAELPWLVAGKLAEVCPDFPFEVEKCVLCTAEAWAKLKKPGAVWKHVAVTNDTMRVALYVDGVLVVQEGWPGFRWSGTPGRRMVDLGG